MSLLISEIENDLSSFNSKKTQFINDLGEIKKQDALSYDNASTIKDIRDLKQEVDQWYKKLMLKDLKLQKLKEILK